LDDLRDSIGRHIELTRKLGRPPYRIALAPKLDGWTTTRSARQDRSAQKQSTTRLRMRRLMMGVVLGAAVFGASAPGLCQNIVLRYAGTLPVSHHISKGQEMFAHLVVEKTGGKVKVENYPAGQLYKAHDIPTAVA